MRQIKFRALCEYETQFNTHIAMVHFGLPEMDNGLWAFPIDRSITHINSHESPLMQFTGLKDRNGVEIYEGDIVKFVGGTCDYLSLNHYGKKHMIGTLLVVSNLLSGFTLQLPRHINLDAPNIVGNIDNDQFWNHQKSFEVIGNIYEHHNLLTNE